MVLTMPKVQRHALNRYSTKIFKAVEKYDKGQELRGKIFKKKCRTHYSLEREKLRIDFPTSYKKKDCGRALGITHFLKKMSSEDFSDGPVVKIAFLM